MNQSEITVSTNYLNLLKGGVIAAVEAVAEDKFAKFSGLLEKLLAELDKLREIPTIESAEAPKEAPAYKKCLGIDWIAVKDFVANSEGVHLSDICEHFGIDKSKDGSVSAFLSVWKKAGEVGKGECHGRRGHLWGAPELGQPQQEESKPWWKAVFSR